MINIMVSLLLIFIGGSPMSISGGIKTTTVAVLFLFYAISMWNQYMNFVMYIRNPELQSLQVIIRQITTTVSKEGYEGMSAAQLLQEQKVRDLLKYCVVVIAALPFTILYPFILRYFNGGVMVGAVKG